MSNLFLIFNEKNIFRLKVEFFNTKLEIAHKTCICKIIVIQYELRIYLYCSKETFFSYKNFVLVRKSKRWWLNEISTWKQIYIIVTQNRVDAMRFEASNLLYSFAVKTCTYLCHLHIRVINCWIIPYVHINEKEELFYFSCVLIC